MLHFTANLSLLFTELPMVERFKAAKQHGFDWVEIQFPYQNPAHVLKNAMDEAGVQLALFNISADDLMTGGEGLAAVPEKREAFIDAVDIAAEYATVLSPRLINVLAGRCSHAERFENYLETFKGNLGFTAETFTNYGIRIVFEAVNNKDMPGFIINSGQQMLDLINDINHPNLFMQYDIYHMYIMEEDPIEFIGKHWNKIGHIQFADVPGRGQPGTGKIDFSALFKCIADSGYRGFLGAEYKPIGNTNESLDWLAEFGQLVNRSA